MNAETQTALEILSRNLESAAKALETASPYAARYFPQTQAAIRNAQAATDYARKQLANIPADGAASAP